MSARLAAVDVGNSAIKMGLFTIASGAAAETPSEVVTAPTVDAVLAAAAAWSDAPVLWRVVSVNRSVEHKLAEQVRIQRADDDYCLLQYRDLPLMIDVDHPDLVGMDRLAAAVAVNALRGAGRPAIVVDAGTAITVDAVSSSGAFLGGAILPGLAISAAALEAGADQLPRVHTRLDDEPPAVGRSTEQAIQSGAFWGAVGAIRELIERMSMHLGAKPQVFVAGGDMRKLASRIHPEAQPVAHLVLSGIAIAVGRDVSRAP